MKFIRLLIVSLFFSPLVASAAGNDFMLAAQLLAAAKSADIQQVQALVNNGADVNFVDSTGVSIVCTALMNNDVRAAQILQMYGADASQCDRQIKQYKQRNKPRVDTGGLFSGLSSAQGMTLAAAGAAVVAGGLFLLTDVLDPGNDNQPPSSGGDRPNNNPGGDGSGSGDSNEAFAKLPYGPACDSKTGICNDVDEWSPSADNVRKWDFDYMKPFNYLLMTYAYNAFARGYLGLGTIRISTDKTPFDLASLPWVGDVPGGGKPAAVAMVTQNGVNPTGSLVDGYLTWVDETQIKNIQSVCTQYGSASVNCQDAMANAIKISRKFINRTNMTDLNDTTEETGFDFSGHGTVFGNASDAETLDGKIIAGWEYGGRATGDAYGFVPNGTLAVYRTGGGLAKNQTVGTVTNASDAKTWTNDDTITVSGTEYKITLATGGTFTAVNVADDSDVLYGTNNGNVLRFELNDTLYEAYFAGEVNSLKQIDVMNYSAMFGAAQKKVNGEPVVSVIANIAQNPASMDVSYVDLDGIANLVSVATQDAGKKSVFAGVINQYYNLDTSDDASVDKPGAVANNLFEWIGNNQNQIIVNSTGAFEVGLGAGMSTATLDATFENFAPVLYPNLKHLFASVVAVQTSKGTGGVNTVSSYTGPSSTTGKIQLSQWQTGLNDNGTPDDQTDDYYEHLYSARKCGSAGLAINGVDPWCFAAPGINAENAVAAMAGGIASVQSAFSYLSNQDVFSLLALTADGAYLGTNPGTGRSWASESELVAYLKERYNLPGDYYSDLMTDAQYLSAFKEVFGYGLINIERATRPGTTIYFFNGDSIVSGDGNAYWRAATNTVFRSSSVLNLGGATISVPFFDVLTSADADIVLPRVWENTIQMGNNDRHALYMGDMLGELATKKDVLKRTQMGRMGIEMAFAQRAYDDNKSGLDSFKLDFDAGKWDFAASYQHHLTDGVSRFDGTAHPILGLVSNAVVSDVVYHQGNWAFGGRVFSGAITDEGLLENDPTISAQYLPATLGLMRGGQSHIEWDNQKVSFAVALGAANETDTLLGAQTGGLFNLGNGNTVYVDSTVQYRVCDSVNLMARATFARTNAHAPGQFIVGVSDIESNAFAFGANIGNLEFALAQPLAITDGALQYARADFDVVKLGDSKYDIVLRDAGIEDIDLHADKRELRFSGTYRHNIGAFTDAAFGFVYRINPNNTDDFGNESVFMLKLTHTLGI